VRGTGKACQRSSRNSSWQREYCELCDSRYYVRVYLQMEGPEIDVSAPESSEVATNKVEMELLESVGAGP
jgi:hypothetical protein